MKTKLITLALIIITTIGCNTAKKNNSKTDKNSDIEQEVIYDNPITEKYWKLKTLQGKNIEMVANQEKEIYFILKIAENSVVGFSGCNTFGGTYTLEKENRIRFTQMLSTLKVCPDVAINESEFLKVFELADNFTINGDILNLNVGKRAPLAVFEAIYF
jgi:heat shock protein HslJ